MKWYIYVLKDPRNDAIRYIGQTTNPNQRLYSHLSEAKNSRFAHTHKNRWINQLLNLELKPILEIIDEGRDGNWQDTEIFWIKISLYMGLDLTNLTTGGEGLHNPSPETRTKLSNYWKSQWSNHERRKILEAQIFTKKRSDKISSALKGRPKTPEHIAKLPQMNKGYKLSPERSLWCRENLIKNAVPAAAKAGLTPAREKHLREMAGLNRGKLGWAKGRILSPEERKIRSDALKGRPLTTDHKEKLRVAALKRWERERNIKR